MKTYLIRVIETKEYFTYQTTKELVINSISNIGKGNFVVLQELTSYN